MITGQTDVASVIRRLDGNPDTIVEQRPLDDDHERPGWYLDDAARTVTLLEVNGFQAGRSAVLRRLSGRSNQMFSAYWNNEGDNLFSYAAAGEVVTQFDGRVRTGARNPNRARWRLSRNRYGRRPADRGGPPCDAGGGPDRYPARRLLVRAATPGGDPRRSAGNDPER